MRRLLRWPIYVPLVALVCAVLAPTLSVGKSSLAHAAQTGVVPTRSLSVKIARPDQTIGVTGTFVFNSSPPIPSIHRNPLYTILVVRAPHRSPEKLTAHFRYLPPRMTATAGIHSGQQIHVHLQNFTPGEKVNISWDANDGQELTAAG